MELSPSDPQSMERPNFRRRLVQMTLFPHKPQEQDRSGHGDLKRGKDCREDELGQDEEDCCGSQIRKRKPRGKASPKTKGSAKRGKWSANSTPKKNGTGNGLKGTQLEYMSSRLIEIEDASFPAPALRLEAKISAEENSRMYAGREIHPFFSSRKLGKKTQEPELAGDSGFSVQRKENGITCGPIHVFERNQDDAISIDWENWTFCEQLASADFGPQSTYSSVFAGCVESLNFHNLASLSNRGASICHNDISCSEQCLMQSQKLQETFGVGSDLPAKGQGTPFEGLEVDKVFLFSHERGCLMTSDTNHQSRFLQERMTPYYHDCDNEPDDSLWTCKYKPTKSLEVCGNAEAMNFVNDWLRLWHERHFQRTKVFSCEEKCSFQGSGDYNCSDDESNSEYLKEGDTFSSVLLIAGPIGSGKSAAVYACAQEQGFEVLELSASDYRNGSIVKQDLGEVFESHRLKRLSVKSISPRGKGNYPSRSALLEEAKDLENEVIKPISISDDEAPDKTTAESVGFSCKRNVITCDKGEVQRLILVEDVDIIFPEDRGLIAAIQHIAETGKGPIILTSNSQNPALPDGLDRQQVCFSLPSSKELLCHLYMVCAAEKVSIHPCILEWLVRFCHGDIRKAITHLQFWFQREILRKDIKAHEVCDSLPFDLEALHHILPKLIPWDFPSQLSELIEKEIAKSVAMMEASSSLSGIVEEVNDIEQNVLGTQHNETDSIEAKKVEMMNRNGSIHDCNEFKDLADAFCEFPSLSVTSVAFSKKKLQRKLVLMSSDSEDGALDNGHAVHVYKGTDNRLSFEVHNEYPSDFLVHQSFTNSLLEQPLYSRSEDLGRNHYQFSETADDACIAETFTSLDVSCVQESSYVPETLMKNGEEVISTTVSSDHLEVSVKISPSHYSMSAPFSISSPDKVQDNLELLVNEYPEVAESFPQDILHDFQDELGEVAKTYHVMDECSQVDFKIRSKLVNNPNAYVEDDVQKSWDRFRDCQSTLRQYTAREELGALQAMKLAYEMADLISDADLLLPSCKQEKHDALDPSEPSSDEAAFSWYNKQTGMSTIFVHGFCFYAKQVTAMGSTMGCENRVDLASVMLSSTSDIMALGKLSRQDRTRTASLFAERDPEMAQPKNYSLCWEAESRLFNMIRSLIPARTYLALKGIAFSEYLSSLRHISRSETFRLSHGNEWSRKRRRVPQHYLSSWTMTLSAEDILLLHEDEFNGKQSSQATTSC